LTLSDRERSDLVRERKENILRTFLANELSGVGQYGVKSDVVYNINYRGHLFIFCKAGVIQMAKPAPFFWGTLFGIIY
jgi:hypothetical protein